MRKDPAILRAEQLRAIMQMPEYGRTIGAWITEAHTAALHDMTTAKEPYEFHTAQGAYKAIQELKDQFDKTFLAEDAAINKLNKQREKEPDHD